MTVMASLRIDIPADEPESMGRVIAATVRDASGDPVVGALIDFAIAGDGTFETFGSVVTEAEGVTDEDGEAHVSWFASPIYQTAPRPAFRCDRFVRRRHYDHYPGYAADR